MLEIITSVNLQVTTMSDILSDMWESKVEVYPPDALRPAVHDRRNATDTQTSKLIQFDVSHGQSHSAIAISIITYRYLTAVNNLTLY